MAAARTVRVEDHANPGAWYSCKVKRLLRPERMYKGWGGHASVGFTPGASRPHSIHEQLSGLTASHGHAKEHKHIERFLHRQNNPDMYSKTGRKRRKDYKGKRAKKMSEETKAYLRSLRAQRKGGVKKEKRKRKFPFASPPMRPLPPIPQSI